MESYLGEIRMFAGDYEPAGWAKCDGRALPIDENEGLFLLIGVTYGGDGQTVFNLPDLRGRAPVHIGTFQGTRFTLGQHDGAEQVALSVSQLPAHHHALNASARLPLESTPANMGLTSDSMQLYNSGNPDIHLTTASLAPAGGSQAHDNMQPFLVINYIISLRGHYPSQD